MLRSRGGMNRKPGVSVKPRQAGPEERLGYYAKPKLLIVDEFGYLPFEPDTAPLCLQPVSRRHERGSSRATGGSRPFQYVGCFSRPDELVGVFLDHEALAHQLDGASAYRRHKPVLIDIAFFQ